MADLKSTPLHEEHVRLGAKMVPFAGFSMPVQYPTGIRREHEAVRSAAGLFDVSHMGEFLVEGPDALAFLSYAITNDPARLDTGQVQYTVVCLPDGGIVDDMLVYRLDEDRFRLVPNASNIAKDWAHLSTLARDFDVRLEDESDRTGLLALQGPSAELVLAPLASADLHTVGYYRFVEGEVAGEDAVISRTGYTGEDGFELYLPAGRTAAVWRALLEGGADQGLIPAGLGCRDSLRLEAGLALYGNDIDEQTSPLEAGLSWLVKLDKESFVGKEALLRQKETGPARKLSGFRLTQRGFPRSGHDVKYAGQIVGPVRSGTVSPSLGVGIGTAYLPREATPGDPVQVRIRDQEVAGEVVRLPFYTEGSVRR